MIELRKDQQRFLDKLIELDPSNQGYRFEQAKIAAANGDQARALSILNKLAPVDTPGYPQAHLVLATQYFEKMARPDQAKSNLDIALKHVNHILTRNKKDPSAKLLKARILTKSQDYESAYEEFEELFELNPNHYREMAALNKLLGREDRNQPLYEKALASFQSLAEKEENQNDDRQWILIETGIAKTLQKLGRHEEAEIRHEEMIERYREDHTGGPRRVFLQRLIADTYIDWASKVADTRASFNSLPPATLEKLLDLYTNAYRNHPKNVVVLQLSLIHI